MRARVLAVLLPPLLLSAGGCSLMLDTSKLDSPAATVAEAEAFAASYYDAFFTRLKQLTGGTDDYVKYRSNLWERADFIARTRDATAPGNRLYDAALATQCYAEIAAAASWQALYDVVRNPARACRRALFGAVPPGDACTWDMECDNDHYCANPGFTCPGTCTARRADGATCTLNELYSECGPLSTCMLSAGSYSSTGTCTYNHADVGAGCGLGASCRAGLYCLSGYCVTGAGSGQDCSTTVCAPGLFCDYSSAPSYCKPVVGLGLPCNTTSGSPCAPGARCSETGICVVLPKDGQTCGMIDAGQTAYCLVGSCPDPFSASTTCPRIRDYAASCTTGDYCKLMGFSCNGGTGKCSQACN